MMQDKHTDPAEIAAVFSERVCGEKHDYSNSWVVDAMKEYARIKVAEQRELMANHLNIRNVPRPQGLK